MSKPTVVVVGSSLKDMGGIVTVIQNIEQSAISSFYRMFRVETYITGNVFHKIVYFFSGLLKFLKILIFKKPDIIHIHMSERGSFYRKAIFLLIGKTFGVPVIIHLHGANFDDFYNSSSAQRKLCDYILNKADKLIVLSVQWKNYYSSIVPSENIEVLYNGVFTDPNKRNYRRSNAQPICLFLGRLGKRKGTYDLIDAVDILKNKGVKAKFLLAGDGEIEEVKQTVEKKSLQDYIEVMGWVNSERREELLKRSDVLVLPSYNEGLPMAILEAMSHSLPIVSTFVGGIPEVISNGKNGFLIQAGNVHDLARSLEELIHNEQLRQSMGEENKNIIHNRFDMKMITQELRGIYQRLIC